jgi:hypothetical protein
MIPTRTGEIKLRRAKGTPVLAMSKDEIFDLTGEYPLERAMRAAGASADAVLMKYSDGEGDIGTTEVARLLRSTDKDSRQTIKASWLILEGDKEPSYIVVHWNLDHMSVYDMGNWIMAKEAEEANSPVKRVRPRLELFAYLEEIVHLPNEDLDRLQT